MKVRNMKKKIIIGLIAIVVIATVAIFAGCVEKITIQNL